jgi:hypothetical protein
MTDWRRYYDDPDTVLKEFEAEVVRNDTVIGCDEGGFEIQTPDPDGSTWYVTWKHGCICLGRVEFLPLQWAKVQAALFCHLWTIGVGAAEADDIACGYALCHAWMKGNQRVYQLQGIYPDGEARWSQRLWYTREAAEAAINDFALSCMQKRGIAVPMDFVNVIPLELRK